MSAPDISAIPPGQEPSLGIIEAAWIRHIEAERRSLTSKSRKYLYASERNECLRQSVIEAGQPEARPEFSTEVKARLMRGENRERDIIIDLMRVGRQAEPGFNVADQQESVECRDRKGRVLIRGKIDGRIHWQKSRRTWPFETKSWSSFLTDRLHTFDDLYQNRWTRRGAFQLLTYLYGLNEPKGLLILDRMGLPRLIEVDLESNLERMESFLQHAEAAVDHLEAGTLPDYYTDIEECRACPLYGGACNPPLLGTSQATIFTDPEFVAMLERREALKEAGKEYRELDEQVKHQLRGVIHGVAGPFAISGKWQKLTRYDVPEEISEKYKSVDPHGRFSISIAKLG